MNGRQLCRVGLICVVTLLGCDVSNDKGAGTGAPSQAGDTYAHGGDTSSPGGDSSSGPDGSPDVFVTPEVCSVDEECVLMPGTGPCTIGKCKASTQTCVLVDGPDGTICDDGDACTTGTACVEGVCGGGALTTCVNDSNPCTDDFCDPVVGCSVVPNEAPCDDGNPCTAADVCAGSVCVGKEMECAEGPDPCSGERCNPETGLCAPRPGCALGEVCEEASGECVSACPDSCDGKVCGPDACGGSCGTCASGKCEAGACVAPCPAGIPVAVIQIEEGEEVIPQTVLHLNSELSHTPSGFIAKWEWSVQQPVGSQSLFNPSDTYSNPTFETNVAGTYLFKLVVWSDSGEPSCEAAEATVVVIPDEAIHIELLWNTPNDLDQTDEGPEAGADVDLHFLHPYAQGPDLDGDGKADGWFDQPFDSFWFNPAPNWGSVDPAIDDDPGLDRDDTDGAGPENLNLNIPEDGKTYRIGVHYWYDHKFGPSYATVRVYIGALLVFEEKDVKLLNHDMWEVGTIEWPSGKVALTPGKGATYKITPNYENPFFFRP